MIDAAQRDLDDSDASLLDTAVRLARQAIPDCVAYCVVDMPTTTMISIATAQGHPASLDQLPDATTYLFRGEDLRTVESVLQGSRRDRSDNRRDFGEIVVLSEDFLHLFMRAPTRPDTAVVAVCRSSVNLGLALAKARSSLHGVEDAI